MNFTVREEQVLKFIAHGYTPDEIGDFLGITRETVRKITCNIKIKAKLQKSTELAALYWCKYFGSSLESQRKQLISTILFLVILFTTPFAIDKNRYRIRSRSNIEYNIRIRRNEI